MVGPRTSPDPRSEPRASEEERRRRGEESEGAEELPSPPAPEGEGAIPLWARFPRSSRSLRGPAFDPDRPPTPEERWEETEQVLKDLDGLRQEVRRGGAGPTASGSPADRTDALAIQDLADTESAFEAALGEGIRPGSPASPVVAPAMADVWAAPTSFLEERLRLASAAADQVSREATVLSDSWGRLRLTATALAEEVRSAREEIEFIRSAGRGEEAPQPEAHGVPAPEPLRSSSQAPPTPRSTAAASAGAMHPGPGHHVEVYSGFTAERYDRTIAQLKARRRRLAGWTFLAAGVLSFVLILVTALAREPLPPIWLAALPAVWMIPVPFFILSFRGTQRVLRNNHLEVRGGAP